MKRILVLALFFVIAFQASAMAEAKIGIVDMKRLVITSDYGKEIGAKMKAKFEPVEKELQKEMASIKKIEDDLKKQGLALKLEAKQDKQREFRRRMRDYQDSVVAYQQKSNAEQQRLTAPVLQIVQQVVNEYGKANGYQAIFDQAGSGVLYIGDGANVTADLLKALNKAKKDGRK